MTQRTGLVSPFGGALVALGRNFWQKSPVFTFLAPKLRHRAAKALPNGQSDGGNALSHFGSRMRWVGSPGGVGTVGAKGGAWREQAPLNSHIKSPYSDKMRRKSVPEGGFRGRLGEDCCSCAPSGFSIQTITKQHHSRIDAHSECAHIGACGSQAYTRT